MPLFSSSKNNSRGRFSMAKHGRMHWRCHCGHHIDDGHGCKYRSPGRADVHLNGLNGVASREVEEDLDHCIGHLVIHATGEKDDPLVQQVLVHEIGCRLGHVLSKEQGVCDQEEFLV